MKLSRDQMNKLRGEEGPYSEVKLVIEDRILDNYVNRQFVEVTANINPLSYEIALQNIDKFNPSIQGMISSAKYIDMHFGYMVSNFLVQVDYEDIGDLTDILKDAHKAKILMRKSVIQIHTFTMNLLGMKH